MTEADLRAQIASLNEDIKHLNMRLDHYRNAYVDLSSFVRADVMADFHRRRQTMKGKP